MSASPLARRDFLERLAVLLAALPQVARATGERLPIGFSTLGCPAWKWLQILDFAQQNGFAAVELRGMQGTMDLPSRREFADEQLEQSKKEIASRGLRISCVSSSANMHDTGPEHEKQLADARRSLIWLRGWARLTCAFSATLWSGRKPPQSSTLPARCANW